MVELVSRRYSAALFDLAVEANSVDTLYAEALGLVATLESETDFLKVINHPEVTLEQKLELLKNVFGGKISETFFGLFNVVLHKNREEEILAILQAFVAKCEEYKGIVEAVVISAKALNEAQVSKIKTKLSQNLNKEVRISTEIDESLIGGMVIYVDGKELDSSVKTYLEEQRKALLANTK